MHLFHFRRVFLNYRIALQTPMAGRSTCTVCAFGSFAASATASACVPCQSGYQCFLGGNTPVALAALTGATAAASTTTASSSDDPSSWASAASANSNPFAASLEARKRALNALLVTIGSGGAALVLLSFIFAIVAHRHAPTRRFVFGGGDDGEKSSDGSAPLPASSSRALVWAQIDVFFSLTHFTANGALMRRRKTTFGGMLSVVCALAIAMLGSMFATKNLLNPTYLQTVSATALPFEPRGTFRLGARVFGGGAAFDSGCANMSVEARASDWAVGAGGALGMVDVDDGGTGRVVQSARAVAEAGGAKSCRLTWQCTQCQMVTASSPVLALRSLQSSWVTFVNFTFEAPPLVVLPGAGSSGSTDASTAALSSAKLAPVPIPAADESIVGGAGLPFVARAAIAPQPSVLRGEAPTRVTLSLVGVAVQTLRPAVGAQATAFTPFVEPFAIGAAMDEATFAFESAAVSASANANANVNGFQIEFVLQRSTIQITWCGLRVQFSVFFVSPR